LVLLPVIIVGQNIQGAASDKRAEQTYSDAEAILHEAMQIQEHLAVQDHHLQRQDKRLQEIIQALLKTYPAAAGQIPAAPE
jgi:Tfp pilus assembly protein PilO